MPNKAKGAAYQPLAAFLAMQTSDTATLSFAEIAAILRRPLPASAYASQWWTSTSAQRTQSQAWRAAGWDATAPTRRDGEWWVRFVRRRSGLAV